MYREIVKKIGYLFSFVLLCLCIVMPNTKAYAETYYCVSYTAVREEPSVKAKELTVLKKGDKVNVVEAVEGTKWLKLDKRGYINRNEVSLVKPIVKTIKLTAKRYNRDYIITDGQVSNYQVNITGMLFDKNPTLVKQLFIDSGWKFVITDKNINETRFNNSYNGAVWGCTSPNEKIIYLWANDRAIEASVIHEMGHFVDFMCGDGKSFKTELDGEFRIIYLLECSKLDTSEKGLSEHAKSKPIEFFGEVYSEYLRNKEHTIETVPMTAEYIEKCIMQVGGNS